MADYFVLIYFNSLSCSVPAGWSLRLKRPLNGRSLEAASFELCSPPNLEKSPSFLGRGPSSSFTSSNSSVGSSTSFTVGGIRGDRWSRLIREGGDRESKLILAGTSKLIRDGRTSMLARPVTPVAGRRSRLFLPGTESLIGDRAEISYMYRAVSASPTMSETLFH